MVVTGEAPQVVTVCRGGKVRYAIRRRSFGKWEYADKQFNHSERRRYWWELNSDWVGRYRSPRKARKVLRIIVSETQTPEPRWKVCE